MEGNIGLLERIDSNHIVAGFRLAGKGAAIFLKDVQVWLAHIKILPGHIDNGRVNLHAIYRDRPIDIGKLARNRPAGQPNNPYPMHLRWLKAWGKEGRSQEIIPIPAVENLIGIIDGVNRLALI